MATKPEKTKARECEREEVKVKQGGSVTLEKSASVNKNKSTEGES